MRSRDIVTLMDEARDTRGQTWRRLDKTALFEPHQPGTSLDTNNSRDKVLQELIRHNIHMTSLMQHATCGQK